MHALDDVEESRAGRAPQAPGLKPRALDEAPPVQTTNQKTLLLRQCQAAG